MESIEDKIDKKKQPLEKYNERIREQKGAAASLHEIDSIVKKTISGKISMAALKRAPRKVKEFIQFMLHTEPEKPEQSRNRDMPRCKMCDIEL